MNKYFKNFILCGDIDHYCLLCRETFQLIPDIEKHIRWEQHRRNIKAQHYVAKFKKELIYKIGNNYYCEICNFVAFNMNSLIEHTRSDKHIAAKNDPKTITKKLLGFNDSDYVVIGKVILNKEQWHCIVDEKCLLCDVVVRNVNAHATFQDHMIKLIQCETRCEKERYYRVINDNIHQCYTCKKYFPNSETFTEHLENSKCDNNDEIDIKKLKEGSTSKDVATDTDNVFRMDDIEKKLIETLQDFYHIDEEENKAACKHCNTFLNISYIEMMEHMKNEHDKPKKKKKRNSDSSSVSSEEEVVYSEVTDSGKRRAELAKYGTEHSIKMNHNGSKGFCNLCNRYLSAHKRIFKEHVNGELHRNHLELKGLKKPKEHETCPFEKQVLHSQSIIIQYSADLRGIWIDKEFWIDINSFFFLCAIKKDPHCRKIKCFACDELFPQGQEAEHCRTFKHRDNFNNAVMIVIRREFIREIRPNLYHCAFCNLIIPFWEGVVKHGMSFKHTFNREEKQVVSNAYEYLRNFSPSSIHIKENDGDDFYTQLIHHVFG